MSTKKKPRPLRVTTKPKRKYFRDRYGRFTSKEAIRRRLKKYEIEVAKLPKKVPLPPLPLIPSKKPILPKPIREYFRSKKGRFISKAKAIAIERKRKKRIALPVPPIKPLLPTIPSPPEEIIPSEEEIEELVSEEVDEELRRLIQINELEKQVRELKEELRKQRIETKRKLKEAKFREILLKRGKERLIIENVEKQMVAEEAVEGEKVFTSRWIEATNIIRMISDGRDAKGKKFTIDEHNALLSKLLELGVIETIGQSPFMDRLLKADFRGELVEEMKRIIAERKEAKKIDPSLEDIDFKSLFDIYYYGKA